MDTRKYFTLFNNHLVELLALIKACVPDTEPGRQEHCKMVAKCYQKYKKVNKSTYVDYTLQKLRPHMKYIIDEDSYIFSNEYSVDSMKLISGLDFKQFWDVLSDSDKAKVWQHLHRLYINGCYAMGQTSDPAAKKLIRNIQTEKRLHAEIANEPDPDHAGDTSNTDGIDTGPGGLMQGLFGLMGEGAEGGDMLNGLFDENNILVKLAKQVGEELSQDGFAKSLGIDPEAPVNNPMEAIMSLFGQDPHKLETLVTSFTDKFQKKMKEQNIDEDDLFKATTEMGQKLLGKIPGMPDLSGFQNLNPDELKNMTPEEQNEKRQQIMDQMCQNMNSEQREQFAQINQMIESSNISVPNFNASGIAEHPGPWDLMLAEAWDLAKVDHIKSLGGEPVSKEEISENDMGTILHDGILFKSDCNFVNCGKIVMKINADKWTEFTNTCTDQIAEINKFLKFNNPSANAMTPTEVTDCDMICPVDKVEQEDDDNQHQEGENDNQDQEGEDDNQDQEDNNNQDQEGEDDNQDQEED